MATAGSVVIDLLMRTGSFETDSKRAEKRMIEMEKTAKKVGAAIGVAMVAAGTAVAVMLKSAINSADEMSKAAQKIGIATEELSRLAYAGDLADVSLGDLQTSMGRLIKSMGDAQNPTSTQARIFDALGISVNDAEGKIRSAGDVLSDFADAFQEQQGSPEIIAAGMEIFGRSFQNLIPLLKDGSEGLREAGAEADRLGVTLSTQTGQQAEAFNDNLTRLQKAAKGLALQVASDLLPDLESLTDRFVDVVSKGGGVDSMAHNIAQGFRVMASAAESSITLVSGVAEVVGGLALQLKGFYEIAASLGTLDFSRRDAGAQMYRAGAAQVNVGADRLINPHGPNGLFNGGSAARLPASAYTGPLLKPSQAVADAEFQAEVEQIKAARKHAERLRAALGDVKPTGPSSDKGAPKMSEAEKAAARLQDRFDNLIASQREQIALFGDTTEAAKIRYATEYGELAGLDPKLKEVLVANAERLDQMRAEADVQAQLDELDSRRAESVERVLESIRSERDVLGMTVEQQDTYNKLRWAGVDANSAFGRSIIEANQALHEQAKAMAVSIDLQDEWRSGLSDAITDVVTGAKSMKEAFADFFDDFAARITEAIANRWIEQLFGEAGSNGGGSAGGVLGGILGMLGFGGAKAGGGDVLGGRAYLVGEQGPEMFVPRTAGTVIPADMTRAALAGGGMTQVNNFSFAAPTELRTQQQVAAKVGFETDRANRRNR